MGTLGIRVEKCYTGNGETMAFCIEHRRLGGSYNSSENKCDLEGRSMHLLETELGENLSNQTKL